ncbi:MAG: hypothetical protein QXT73_01185 [Candidatus Methanomethylicaceae archaeon]
MALRVYIQGCHASLEYDHIVMFKGLGFEVRGSFDAGSPHRPHLPGVDMSFMSPDEGLEWSDVFLLYEVENFPVVFREVACRKRSGIVVLHLFGQGDVDGFLHVVETLNAFPRVFAVAYSRTDFHRMTALGCNPKKLKFIRFGKVLGEFRFGSGWKGVVPCGLVVCNGMARRGEGCGYRLFEELKKDGLPVVLVGKHSLEDDEYGVGELSYDSLRRMYQLFRCLVSFGTVPAPYLLSITEAVCSGMPVVAYDNMCGIRDEGIGGVVVCSSVLEVGRQLDRLIKDMDYAKSLSKEALVFSDKEFDMNVVAYQWADALRRWMR